MKTKKDELKQHVLGMCEYDYDLNDEDLHHKIFNTSYYVYGYRRAVDWLGDDTWAAIKMIAEYDEHHFGERYTDLTCPETVANKLAYILGGEIINELQRELS